MKCLSLPLAFLTALPSQAQIFADFETSLGDFSVVLDYENAPLTAANFILLAEGSRPWIDSTTGVVWSNTPYYDGIIFHRVIDGFMIQGGSPNGQGTDGPGYRFPDETDNGLTFDRPFLLAMANSGPNTNGSQFFITEQTPNWLNGDHTIFGEVASGTATIHAILETATDGDDRPTTPVVIESVSIHRQGTAAESFDETAQGVPRVTALAPPFTAEASALRVEQPANSILQVASSPDLQEWSTSERFRDGESGGEELFPTSGEPRAFFRTTLIEHPYTLPQSYLGRTLTFELEDEGSTTLVVQLNAADATIGDEGTLTIGEGSSPITEVWEEFATPYTASLVIFSENYVPFRFELASDSATHGRMDGTAFFDDGAQPIFGTFSLTTP
ncbi:peptidylprolyl isomerase [Roseibacillus ishigakijimensis]|uniref:peptidylprolyl isomerase n=1 Tax=Roseibacillus ishigakijimensis TaxID=454146 RepID=A0A934RPW6_9BACT|nr:peptidylprolyl isomerase [Roseibacillus ishigakijimensis]MBK1832929.1 peptidylprolyl isomerase [Roseibacillus ishigakijimensis]